MQAISRKRHGHLKDALLQMEGLLSDRGRAKESACLQQAENYNCELEIMYLDYERLLKELSRQISAYEILYSKVKVQFLGTQLREQKTKPLRKLRGFVGFNRYLTGFLIIPMKP